VHRDATVMLPLADVIDLDQEKARLEKSIAKADGEITKLQKKLQNQKFLSRAPEEVVKEQKNRLTEEKATKGKLTDALERLSAMI
jgi:valyl-tRNA synthetase